MILADRDAQQAWLDPELGAEDVLALLRRAAYRTVAGSPGEPGREQGRSVDRGARAAHCARIAQSLDSPREVASRPWGSSATETNPCLYDRGARQRGPFRGDHPSRGPRIPARARDWIASRDLCVQPRSLVQARRVSLAVSLDRPSTTLLGHR